MNYIKHIRQFVGHETLFTVGCGVMEIGESFEQTAIRETIEETGLKVQNLQLFGLYSGDGCFVEYPNKDKMYSVQIIFITTEFTGELIQTGEESRMHKFFDIEELPTNINPRQINFIQDWALNRRFPIIS